MSSHNIMAAKRDGVTSRGASEEHWYAVKHALHTEGHLEEMISQAAVARNIEQLRFMMKALDDTRVQRQELVKMAFMQEAPQRPVGFMQRLTTYWCAVKHVLLMEGHLEEAIANAARRNDLNNIRSLGNELAKTYKKRRGLVAVIMDDRQQPMSGCLRCAGDLRSR